MEIHFYEDQLAPVDCLHGWLETRIAIVARKPMISTTQMGLLSTNLFDYGYKIYLREDKEIKLGLNACTGREIRMGHNLFKLWDSGEFGL